MENQSFNCENRLSVPLIFPSSLLDGQTQASLVQEITNKILPQDDPKKTDYFISFSYKYHTGAINRAFEITQGRPSVPPDIGSVDGPYDIQMVGALTYLQQEASVLSAISVTNTELHKYFQSLGIRSPRPYAEGIESLFGMINIRRRYQPELSDSEIIDSAIKNGRKSIVAEIEDYRLRYEDAHKSFGYGENSTAYAEWKGREDKSKGFENGIKLLGELLQFKWNID